MRPDIERRVSIRTRRQACLLRSCVLLISLAVGPLSTAPAFAAFSYIDTTAKTGLPDVTQDGKGGICAAAAMDNAFWNWSAFAPFNAPNHPLIGHTKRTDFAFNWGADADAQTTGLANFIYGPVNAAGERTGGLGVAAGAVYRASSNGQAYNKSKYPNGLSIEYTFGWNNISYSKLNDIVQGKVQNAVIGLKWYQADGTVVKRPAMLGGGERFHAVTLTGMDNAAQKMAISNPWGDHAATPRVQNEPNPPVDVAYYDNYTLDATTITNADRAVIKKAGAGNAGFVSSFDDATYTADYMRPVALWQVKRGGSPNVVGDIIDNAGYQSVRYVVENPDSPEPISNAYILLDPNVINIAQAYSAATSWLATNEPDWTVSILDPNVGVTADLFGSTGEDVIPDPSDYQLANWESGAAGLVFSTSLSSSLLTGESVTLGFDMPGHTAPELWSNVYAAATQDSSHSWWGVWGVQIPEPRTLVLLACSSFLVAQSRRTSRRSAGSPSL